jgi:hypothetical protein
MTRVVNKLHVDFQDCTQTDTNVAIKVPFPIYQHSLLLSFFNVVNLQQGVLLQVRSRCVPLVVRTLQPARVFIHLDRHLVPGANFARYFNNAD